MLKALKLDQPGTAVLGHNMAGFDALILSEYYKIKPYMILDTICCARWCGIARLMPERHAVLTDYLKHGTKQAGTVVSDRKRFKSDFTPDEWTFFKQYCADDTYNVGTTGYYLIDQKAVGTATLSYTYTDGTQQSASYEYNVTEDGRTARGLLSGLFDIIEMIRSILQMILRMLSFTTNIR